VAAVLWVFFAFPRKYVVCAVEQNALDRTGSVSEFSSYYISQDQLFCPHIVT